MVNIGDMKNEQALFVMAMKSTLSKHEKTKGDSWKTCDIEFLENKLIEEFEEYQESKDKHELIDIANICMFLFNRKLKNILELKKNV